LTPPNKLTGWSLEERQPQVIEKLLPFYGWFYQYYFRVKTDGWENIPREGQVLLIGSHNGGLAAPDLLMVAYDWFRRFGTGRLIYGLMDCRNWEFLPGLARLATQVGAIQSNAQMAEAALGRGASLLIYPGGIQDLFRPFSLRNTIYFGGHRGFVKLALQQEVPIIPLICHGAHSRSSWGIFILNCSNYTSLVVLVLGGWELTWVFGRFIWGCLGGLPLAPCPISLYQFSYTLESAAPLSSSDMGEKRLAIEIMSKSVMTWSVISCKRNSLN
jgi:hypothetical protein